MKSLRRISVDDLLIGSPYIFWLSFIYSVGIYGCED